MINATNGVNWVRKLRSLDCETGVYPCECPPCLERRRKEYRKNKYIQLNAEERKDEELRITRRLLDLGRIKVIIDSCDDKLFCTCHDRIKELLKDV